MSESDLRRRLDSVTAELLATYEELEVLSTVAEIAGSTADVAAVGKRILDEAAGLLEADVAFLIYTDAELKGEEPPPAGITAAERDALATVLGRWLGDQPRPTLMAPFVEGAGVPHAPDALLAVPLLCEGVVLGAICLGRRGESESFTAGDLKILSVLGSSAAAVLLQRKNLDLVRMTRRLEERNQLLKGILAISREIAASLDLDRLLHALANLPTKALGFDRCAVMLEEGARRRLRAVSGVARIDRADAELKSLERVLEWVAGRATRVIVQAAAGGSPAMAAEPPEAAAQLEPHFTVSGAKSFLALPLVDDQGLLGVLSLESGTESYVDDVRLEGATILANQATVALRNARLYGDVPLIGLLAPLRGGLARAGSLPRRKMAVWGAGAAVVLALLVFGRWDLRVPGRVTVLPQRIVQVSAKVRGVIREVGPFKEGDLVPKGAVLARLEVPDMVLRHNEAVAREETAERTMTRLEAEGRAAEVRLTRVDAERWRIEKEHLASRLEEASLRAPFEGVLLTPRLSERMGELLDVGGVFCAVAQMEPLRVEIAVREYDADVLLREEGGDPLTAALKFYAFPEADFEARIDHVRSAAELVDGARSLVVEGIVRERPGSPGAEAGAARALRPGMTGNARVDAGPRPLIALLLRKPYKFVRSLIWL